MFFKVNVQAAPPNYKGVVCSDSAGGGRNRAWHEGNLYQDANCHVGDTVRMSLSSVDIAKLTTYLECSSLPKSFVIDLELAMCTDPLLLVRGNPRSCYYPYLVQIESLTEHLLWGRSLVLQRIHVKARVN